jgi:hypothetical protein
VEDRVYYVQMMVVEPVMSNQYYKFGSSHFMCCFTSNILVREIRIVNDAFIQSFSLFMSLDRVFQFTIDSNMYVDKYLILFISSGGVTLLLNNVPTNYL